MSARICTSPPSEYRSNLRALVTMSPPKLELASDHLGTAVTKTALMNGRWVAERAMFRDALKNEGGTEFVILSIEFDGKIPDHVFSQASLRK